MTTSRTEYFTLTFTVTPPPEESRITVAHDMGASRHSTHLFGTWSGLRAPAPSAGTVTEGNLQVSSGYPVRTMTYHVTH